MTSFCPDCGIPKSEHEVKRVVTETGMRRVKICPVERRRGPTLAGQPTVLRPKRPTS
jgi:hypothetical protein